MALMVADMLYDKFVHFYYHDRTAQDIRQFVKQIGKTPHQEPLQLLDPQ